MEAQQRFGCPCGETLVRLNAAARMDACLECGAVFRTRTGERANKRIPVTGAAVTALAAIFDAQRHREPNAPLILIWEPLAASSGNCGEQGAQAQGALSLESDVQPQAGVCVANARELDAQRPNQRRVVQESLAGPAHAEGVDLTQQAALGAGMTLRLVPDLRNRGSGRRRRTKDRRK